MEGRDHQAMEEEGIVRGNVVDGGGTALKGPRNKHECGWRGVVD